VKESLVNHLQNITSKLFNVPIEDVPNFGDYPDKWGKFIFYVYYMEYNYDGCLLNYRCCKGDIDNFLKLEENEGINGIFMGVLNTENSEVVLINKQFEIVHRELNEEVNEEFGYNGIKYILLINPKSV